MAAIATSSCFSSGSLVVSFLQIKSRQAQDLYQPVIASSRPLEQLIRQAGYQRQHQYPGNYSDPHVGPAHEGVGKNCYYHHEHQKAGAAARVKGIELLSVFGVSSRPFSKQCMVLCSAP